ncbi:alpha/beta hydrolase [Ekhidna sp.]
MVTLKKMLSVILLSTLILSCNTNPATDRTSSDTEASSQITLSNHTVISDGHPMNLWEKKSQNSKGAILFIHGRTWSSLPNFDLQVEGENLSLMDAMVTEGYSTYALDLRGYGATPRDSTEWLSPNKAASDILHVVNWIASRNSSKVHLFGYSMGSTSSLLATQKNATDIASLTVFGYWLDLDFKIPESPGDIKLLKQKNTAENAASDFITPGSISQNAIDSYVRMA